MNDFFLFSHVRNWYAKWERPISSLSLVGGFIFDAVTLTRIDAFWDNFWVVAHLVIVAVAIIAINREEETSTDYKDPARMHFWLINVLQFFFGGLLSTFLVFYFRSATLSVSWPFFLILAVAFIANESFKKHFARIVFQVSFFFLCLFSFDIFLVPVVVHSIGRATFVLSDIVTLAILGIFLWLLASWSKGKLHKSARAIFISIAGIFVIINILYFLNIIPPIPLSLRDAGIYHSVSSDGNGNYIVSYEDRGWLSFFDYSPDFHEVSDASIYAYTAIFSPANLSTNIIHNWQRYDDTNKSWVTVSRVELFVSGGRDGGFRTYSIQSNLLPGDWRVSVETPDGAVVGRLRFTIVSGSPVNLKTEIKN